MESLIINIYLQMPYITFAKNDKIRIINVMAIRGFQSIIYVSLQLCVQMLVSPSTLCWKIPNISGSVEPLALYF